MNFINKLSKKNNAQSSCCGVEIKEVKDDTAGSCCGTESAAAEEGNSVSGSCCGTDDQTSKGGHSSCC